MINNVSVQKNRKGFMTYTEYALFTSVLFDFDLRERLIKQTDTKLLTKVSFFIQCSKMQIIPIKKINIQICFLPISLVFQIKMLISRSDNT
jgi:hypothetical protein